MLAGPVKTCVWRTAWRICCALPVSIRWSIMAVTFTNKALARCASHLTGCWVNRCPAAVWPEGLTIGTFHSLCARILRQSGSAAGIDPQFIIYDDEDQISLLKRSLQELNLEPPSSTRRAPSPRSLRQRRAT